MPVARKANLTLMLLSTALSNWNACLQKSPRTVLFLEINYSQGRAAEHQSQQSFVYGVSVGEALDSLRYSISWTKLGRTTPPSAQLYPAGTKANRR